MATPNKKSNHVINQTKSKLLHSVASPFPDPEWPKIDAESQDTILELFCQLLEPLGRHQRTVCKSKGKRKKREVSERTKQGAEVLDSNHLRVPEISSHLTIGFRSTHRLLEELVSLQGANNLSSKPVQSDLKSENVGSSTTDKEPKCTRLAAVLVDRSSQPAVMIQHLPIMMATAAKSLKPGSQLRLVTLPNGSEEKLRNSAGIPRVGLFGLLSDAPGSGILLKYIESHVPPVPPLSFSSPLPTKFLPLNVETKTVEVPASKIAKHSKSKDPERSFVSTNPTDTKELFHTVDKHVGKKRR